MQKTVTPTWFEEHKKPLLDRIKSWRLHPFDQPSDTTGYISCHHNDYLRLSQHPEVIEERVKATTDVGYGVMASVVYGGEHGYHLKLKEAIAKASKVQGPECVLLTTCGWTANVGMMEAIVRPETPVYLDVNAHASLWDGARFSGGKLIPVKHNCAQSMRKMVKVFGPGVIVIDGYYSTHGAVANVSAYADIAEEFKCLLVVDEAHSFGMIGENGGGCAVDEDVQDRVHLRTVSIAKALGGNGGFVVTDPHTAEYLMYRARSVIFSTNVAPPTSAGNWKALDILMREPQRAAHTQRMAAYLRELFNNNGISTGPSACQIVSLMFKGEDPAIDLYGRLKEMGVLFSVFLYPATPKDTSLARFSIFSEITKEEIETVAESTLKCLRDMGVTETQFF
ncbi:aminotransferase class I/II-fold pyridoxal phosphate-dependent enzyme [Chitinispirillales bacterium ANBcel5]|uniref:aminotransferase class I/II-fold pyridoxal phosphate-dependent enzyme n=1 Tax=Cellulosispirillum alkaliphilum TaxID=3039283 RepID=UPI002A4F283C|nr:aminotransferase class I/II-fold pyridoxal phosphate-dependent enzyme [Chitinispirillales bacterium ANBcel5]